MVCHTFLLHVSDSSSVHHQEFLTVHTAMICHKGLLRVSYSSSVRHQEISTIHTPMVYVIKVCYMFRTVPLSIIRNFSLYIQQWYMSYRFADSLRAGSGRSFLILAVCSVRNSWWWTEELSETCSKPIWYIPLPCVQWEIPDDGQRKCLKHVANLYDIYHCCVYSEKFLMKDRGTVRNMYSFIPKTNLRN